MDLHATDGGESPATSGNPPKNSPPKNSQRQALSRNQQTGLKLFAVYCAAYSAFIGLNVAAPQVMPIPVLAGVNLAIVFGMSLILLAFPLSLIYLWIASYSVDGAD